MATKLGQPGRALGLSTLASTFGGIFSTICLILLAPQLAKVALQFSKPEYFALAIFGLSIITSVSSGSVIKGIMGGLIGLFLATVGIDGMSGAIRFTLDTNYFMGGSILYPCADRCVRLCAGVEQYRGLLPQGTQGAAYDAGPSAAFV